MSRKSRELSADELALWDYVTRNVKRPYGRTRAPPPAPPSPVKPKAPAVQHAVQPLPSPPRALVLGANDGIDRRTAQRFARGEMDAEEYERSLEVLRSGRTSLKGGAR